MPIIIQKYTPQGDFPVPLGSALRNPSYSYSNWNIDEAEEVLRVSSDRAYHTEWEEGSPKQMQYVIEAATTAGLGNCSGMLRDLQAKTVHGILNLRRLKKSKRINYTEIGAGKSTVVLFNYLLEKRFDIGRIFSTLVEPSAKRLSATAAELEQLGLEECRDFLCIVGKDSELPAYLEPSSQDIVAANATLHHHAYHDRIFTIIHNLLAESGFFGNFEWFEGLCEHPARVYQALRDHKFKPPITWETKERDLAAYARMFPKAWGQHPEFSAPDEMAARQIITFWLDGWAVVRAKAIDAGEFDPRDDYFLHEAHGRPEFQERELRAAGFSLTSPEVRHVMEATGYNSNPHRILTKEEMMRIGMDRLHSQIPDEGSNLLMAFLVQKR